MKKVLATLGVASVLLVGTLVSAQDTSDLPTDSDIVATFYDGNPYDGGEAVGVSKTLNIGNLGSRINDIEDADFVLLQAGEGGLAFEISSGENSPIGMDITGINGGNTLRLSDVYDDVADALNGKGNFAAFIDENGAVVGFYTFSDQAAPNVDVDDAAYVVLTYNGQATVFNTRTSDARPLGQVSVDVEGESVSLQNLALRAN